MGVRGDVYSSKEKSGRDETFLIESRQKKKKGTRYLCPGKLANVSLVARASWTGLGGSSGSRSGDMLVILRDAIGSG